MTFSRHGLAFLLAFGTALALTPLVASAARKLGFVAQPREDRWNRKPTALLGGAAILGGLLAPLLLVPIGPAEVATLVGLALIFVLGLLDDVVGLTPPVKLAGQAAVALAALLLGAAPPAFDPPLLFIPLAVLWIVAITNALNLLDNIDGLAAGAAGVAGSALAIGSALRGAGQAEFLALALAGAAFGFLVFNFHPARIFMGDGGSHLLGFALAVLALREAALSGRSPVTAAAIPLIILAVPIFDTTLVVFSRLLRGKPVFQGGKDHVSHRLVLMGMPVRRAVLVLMAAGAILGGISLWLDRAGEAVAAAALAIMIAAAIALGAFLERRTDKGV